MAYKLHPFCTLGLSDFELTPPHPTPPHLCIVLYTTNGVTSGRKSGKPLKKPTKGCRMTQTDRRAPISITAQEKNGLEKNFWDRSGKSDRDIYPKTPQKGSIFDPNWCHFGVTWGQDGVWAGWLQGGGGVRARKCLP